MQIRRWIAAIAGVAFLTAACGDVVLRTEDGAVDMDRGGDGHDHEAADRDRNQSAGSCKDGEVSLADPCFEGTVEGRCALDEQDEFFCCTGCIANDGRCVSRMLSLSDALTCGVGGAACASCDSSSCSTGACTNGQCVGSMAPGVACDDEDACTINDKCNEAGQCVGSPKDCSDTGPNAPCTKDICNPETGSCSNEADVSANDKKCSDGDACTNADRCSNGLCTGTPVSCDDGEACTTDLCQSNGTCSHSPVDDDTVCDDGNSCSFADACKGGVCHGQGSDCVPDGDPCTINRCNADTNLCEAPVAMAGTSCSDGNPCTVSDQCNASGKCVGTAVDCDDHDPCTVDACDAVRGCINMPVSGPTCTDGDPCTSEDKCDDGVCKGKAIKCEAM